MNRILLEKARCMLYNVGLKNEFQTEAVNTACYLVNRSPSTEIKCKTPNEVWSGKPSAETQKRGLQAMDKRSPIAIAKRYDCS